MKKIALILFLSLLSLKVYAACGKDNLFNPVTEANWDNMFPMKLLSGITINNSSNKDPSEMKMPAVCNCNNPVGVPVSGVGVTFWNPEHVIEVVTDAGCSPTIGTEVLGGYEQKDGYTNNHSDMRHIHWLKFPVFNMLNLFADFSCLSLVDDFTVGYMSEIDPIYLDTEYSTLVNPEASLFASPEMVMSCVADNLSSQAGYPVDSLFWCAGAYGTIYPLNAYNHTLNSNSKTGLLYAHKTLFKLTRMFMIGETIGSNAQCRTQFTTKLNKSQFRFNPIRPKARTTGKAIGWGMSDIFAGNSAYTSFKKGGSNYSYLIWQGRQCCVGL